MARTDDAIKEITSLIASGRWGPGDRLPREADLAAELGLSRSSLREAVKALELVGVLDVRQGDGTFVTSLEPAHLSASMALVGHILQESAMDDLFEVRRLLEPAAAAMAASRMPPGALEEMRAQLARLAAAGTLEERVEADAEFHRMVTAAAGNDVLGALLEALATAGVAARLWAWRQESGQVEAGVEEHARILEALEVRDAELARTLAGAHLATAERLKKQLEGGEQTEERS